MRIGHIQEFDTPRQGIGARGVNHLSSRLLLTLLPPSSPFFKFKVDPFALDEITQLAPEIQAEIASTLGQIEDSVNMVINTEGYRTPSAELFKHLLCSGNGATEFPKDGGMRFFPLSAYVVCRDPEGDEEIEIIIKECIDRASLPEDLQKMVDMEDEYEKTKDKPVRVINQADGTSQATVDFYTRQTRISKKRFEKWQELSNGTMIPGTKGTYNDENRPIHAHRWLMVPGEAYGRGIVEEHKGDLINCEALSQAIMEGSLAAARVIGLVAPNAQTRPQDINDAANGEFVIGRPEDIQFLSLEGKVGDFRVALETLSLITKRLEQAFLLNSSVIRDAERVTAEEVRFAAQELETTLGGTYTILASEFQLPLAKSILGRLQKKGKVPQFPPSLKDKIKLVIVTGVDALGRNEELERLKSAMGTIAAVLGPEVLAASVNVETFTTYVLSKSGVTIKGIFKTKEQKEAEAQQAQTQAMAQQVVEKGTGPAINAVSAATQQQNAPQTG